MQKMKMKVSGENEGLKSIVKAGKHEVIVDEAPQMGGKNEGPNPLQYMLSALVGCGNVVAHLVAKEMEFDLQGLTFEASGEFDPRGFMGDPNVRTYFETVTVNVKVKTSESEERIKELQEKVEARCPVYGTFKAANIEMKGAWTKAE